MALIAPSILSADFLNLGRDIEMVNNSEADWFHLDIMDGRFVPNISYGMSIIAQMKKAARKTFDVHLMIVEPEKYLKNLRKQVQIYLLYTTKRLHTCIVACRP